MEETNTVVLSDGRKLVLEDDYDIILSFASNNKTVDSFEIPYPSEDWEEKTDVGRYSCN